MRASHQPTIKIESQGKTSALTQENSYLLTDDIEAPNPKDTISKGHYSPKPPPPKWGEPQSNVSTVLPSPISLQPSQTEETRRQGFLIFNTQFTTTTSTTITKVAASTHSKPHQSIEVTSPTHTRTKCKSRGKALRNGDPSDQSSVIRSTHTKTNTKHFTHTHIHGASSKATKAGSSVTSLQTHSLEEYVVAEGSSRLVSSHLTPSKLQCGWLARWLAPKWCVLLQTRGSAYAICKQQFAVIS